MGYSENFKERVCEDCGTTYIHSYNIKYCPACRSRRQSEVRKRDIARCGVYSFDRWEDCIVDVSIIKEGIKSCDFILKHFRDVDGIKQLQDKLLARLSRLIVENEGIGESDSLKQSEVWKSKCEYFIESVLYDHFVSIEDDLPLEIEEQRWKEYEPYFKSFKPSDSLCAHLVSHFKNHQRARDPLKLMPLMLANLELSIIKEFKEQFSKEIYETN